MAPLTKEDLSTVIRTVYSEEVKNQREDIGKIFDKLEEIYTSVAVMKATLPKQPCDGLKNITKVLDNHLDMHLERTKDLDKKTWDVFLRVAPPVLTGVLAAVAAYYFGK